MENKTQQIIDAEKKNQEYLNRKQKNIKKKEKNITERKKPQKTCNFEINTTVMKDKVLFHNLLLGVYKTLSLKKIGNNNFSKTQPQKSSQHITSKYIEDSNKNINKTKQDVIIKQNKQLQLQ